MVNLKLDEKEVLTERQVILEERRSRVENSPSAILDEQMNAALYMSHPYGIPVIGWEHEMAKLSPADAMTFYKRFYAPNNAILVVTGDVTADEVKTLAEETYGKIPSNKQVTWLPRRQEPPHRAARRVELKDPRAGKASVHRLYLAPSYLSAKEGEAEALDLLLKIAASGPTSRLYKKLVMEDKLASSAGGWYSGAARDSGKISIYAVAADGIGLDKVEAGIDAVHGGGAAPTVSPKPSSSARANRISPSTSTSPTTRPRWRAATAGRSPSAARSRTSRNGRPASPKSRAMTSRRRPTSIWISAIR